MRTYGACFRVSEFQSAKVQQNLWMCKFFNGKVINKVRTMSDGKVLMGEAAVD